MSSLTHPTLALEADARPGKLQRPLLLALIGGVWLLCVIVGIGLLWGHSHTAGELDEPPAVWPADSALPHHAGRPTLIFFAHPQCPCTLASLRELDRLLADVAQPIDTVVAFAIPNSAPQDWTDTAVWSMAHGIAGVKTYDDEDSVEAKRFAVKTSGQICLYGADGRLLYHGGITSARGHEGDNTGRSAIQSLLSGGHADRCSPVYGCSLNTPAHGTGD